ncbi:hypothetical protein [Halorubrum sp. DTA46]|uniref:hypothetical protein n=1 Tax=Halorubrum sp. DTA46 TaxID=3402162 RepID=UPI003AAF0A82
MCSRPTVGLIAYPVPDEAWAREVAETAEGDLVLVVSDPPESFDAPYADSVLRTKDRLGFGRSRRLSMVLAGELGDTCVVADGDGQYVASEIRRIQRRLRESDADVIIPQRTSRTVRVKLEDEWVSRAGFERLETLCAGRAAGVDVDPSFDCQPGGFGFDRRALPEILPESDWLADWEITVRVLASYDYETLDVDVNDEAQAETTFTWADQLSKLRRLEERLETSVESVFDAHLGAFDDGQRALIRTALTQLEGDE